jgi:hypothetical protein
MRILWLGRVFGLVCSSATSWHSVLVLLDLLDSKDLHFNLSGCIGLQQVVLQA